MTSEIAFNVNETLLGRRALDALFEELLGRAQLRARVVCSDASAVVPRRLTSDYVDFGTAQHAALRMIARRGGQSGSDAEAEEMVGRMRSLPPDPEVAGAPARRRDYATPG